MKTNQGFIGTVLLLVCSSGWGPVPAGDLSGKITLQGKPPPEVVIDAAADPVCAQMHPRTFTTRHFVVGSGGGLGDVFVHVVSGLNGKTYPAPATPVVLDQKGCFYSPYVLGLQVNQPLRIENSDATLHNVHAVTKSNREFNIAQPTQGMTSIHKFEKPEVFVKFKCEVHPWMFAYVGVVDHPFYAVTSADGAYAIKGLPAGKYVLEAIHPKLGPQRQEVTVGESGGGKADFTFAVKAGG
jgi:hypothetical protein